MPAYPLDVLGAETQGMVGYLIEQELGNRLPDRLLVTVLTMVEVDPADPAFADPTKPVGPQYDAGETAELAVERGWTFKLDGDRLRRVVPSPRRGESWSTGRSRILLDAGCVVVCAGGGGIPTAPDGKGGLRGIEAVVDKDSASALLARDLDADLLVLATDTPAAYLGFGTDHQRAVSSAHPDAILAEHAAEFAAGSMLPKITAACEFARQTHNRGGHRSNWPTSRLWSPEQQAPRSRLMRSAWSPRQ